LEITSLRNELYHAVEYGARHKIFLWRCFQ